MIPEDLDPDLIRDKMEIIVAENGNIEMNSGMQKYPMQTIGIWDFSDKDDLFEISDTRFIPKDPQNNPELRSEKFIVQQGMIELSNTNVIREMISTISTTRNYENGASYGANSTSNLTIYPCFTQTATTPAITLP